ncbi:RICIN domain-containing protein [Streptomyces sp. NPDC059991]|uniref:RICIN domain-containing protein n=1 Tax=Streptomyces sp. NPDC059991 TaxID=3347028 RepID=UPI0036AA372A
MPTGWVTVSAQHSGECVGATSAGTADGAAVQQYGCNATTAQQWRLQDAGDGHVRVDSRKTGPRAACCCRPSPSGTGRQPGSGPSCRKCSTACPPSASPAGSTAAAHVNDHLGTIHRKAGVNSREELLTGLA